MTTPGIDPGDRCVLILAPRGRDAAVVASVLAEHGVATLACGSLVELAERLDRPVGAVLATEETLTDDEQPALIARMDAQPAWSDLPVIVLATKQSGRRPAVAMQRLARLGNVVLLERPLNADTLASAVTSALRARARQYQVRANLEEQARINADNVRLNQASVQALKQAAEAREEAERVSRLKDEFLATLSHELRTPLSAILGWTQLMRRPALPPREFAKGVDVIERNARAQAWLIEELLDMSRAIAGSMRLNIEPIDPAAVVEAALASLQPAAAAKGIAIRRKIDGGLGSIAADPHRLQQMLWNLLSNAVKFTPGGGEIEVALRRRRGALEFVVTDSGEGIAADFLPFVFDRFRQADASTTRDHGGLGLGLAIVRHLAELHGGTVAVSSDGPGRGARFVVCLPLGAAQVSSDAQAVAARAASRPPKPPAGNADLTGLTIVAVDDEADGRELLAQLLSAHGARIVSAASAEEALAAIDMVGPDLLISDIAMPKVDGHELLHRVRALWPALPAIALSAFARADDRRRALEAGYSVHLAKPVDVDELLRAIAVSLQRGG